MYFTESSIHLIPSLNRVATLHYNVKTILVAMVRKFCFRCIPHMDISGMARYSAISSEQEEFRESKTFFKQRRVKTASYSRSQRLRNNQRRNSKFFFLRQLRMKCIDAPRTPRPEPHKKLV